MDDKTYSIVRFFLNAPSEVQSTGHTLEEAQAHCSSEDTHGDGWFDGYREEYMANLEMMFDTAEYFPPWFDWSAGNHWLKSALVKSIVDSELPIFVPIED